MYCTTIFTLHTLILVEEADAVEPLLEDGRLQHRLPSCEIFHLLASALSIVTPSSSALTKHDTQGSVHWLPALLLLLRESRL